MVQVILEYGGRGCGYNTLSLRYHFGGKMIARSPRFPRRPHYIALYRTVSVLERTTSCDIVRMNAYSFSKLRYEIFGEAFKSVHSNPHDIVNFANVRYRALVVHDRDPCARYRAIEVRYRKQWRQLDTLGVCDIARNGKRRSKTLKNGKKR